MTIPRYVSIPLFALPWLIAIAGFGWLAYLRFPPSGIFVADSQLDGHSAWIFPFLPGQRVSTPGAQADGWTGQRITGDPVYFSSRVPGPYESADVSIEYRVNRQPLLEFGIVRDPAGNELDLSPMYAEELQNASWTRVSGGYVRADVSLSRLLDPDTRGLATWYASSTMPQLADADHVIDETTTRVSLRGSHDFYLVPMDGTINVTFNFQDVNRKTGSDAIVIRAFRGDREFTDETYAQSVSNEKAMGAVQTHRVTIPNAGPGVYRVSFIAPDDVFIRSIETTSKRWVIGPRVYIGDTVGYPETEFPGRLWTTSRHLVAQTFHAEGIQTVAFGSVSGNISRTHETVRVDRSDAETRPVILSAPRGDIRFELDGFAAFRPDAFFEPKPRRLTDATRLLDEGVEAVRTPYRAPQKLDDGWRSSTFAYAIPANIDTLRFVLSAPGLASRAGSVDIRRIRIQFARPAATPAEWWRTLRQEIANAWHRL